MENGNLWDLKASGALLVNKHQGVSSFGIIELLQDQLQMQFGIKRKQQPKIGHGGTIDPFATGLLVVCVGKAVKLARYFLGGTKRYEGVIFFGETTVPGDPTAPVSEKSEVIPGSIEEVGKAADKFSKEAYLQKPPMHSAKKKNGKPLYELARAGIEVDREAKLCHLYSFKINSYQPPRASFDLICSSGTYVRTLAQDIGKSLGTVAMLETLTRTQSGAFKLENAWTIEQIADAGSKQVHWWQLPCWIPFDRMLDGYRKVSATSEEAEALCRGQQNVLFNILKRSSLSEVDSAAVKGQESCVVVYHGEQLLAVVRRQDQKWELERVFLPNKSVLEKSAIK